MALPGGNLWYSFYRRLRGPQDQFGHEGMKKIFHLAHTFNIVAPLIYHLLPSVWKASYTISATIFVDVPYSPPYSKDKFGGVGSVFLPGVFPQLQDK